MTKKMTIEQKILEHLDSYGYITDTSVAKIYGTEPNWSTVEEYKRRWKRLNQDRDYFKDKEIIGVEKWGKKHLAKLNDGYRYISKLFYEEIKPKFKKIDVKIID